MQIYIKCLDKTKDTSSGMDSFKISKHVLFYSCQKILLAKGWLFSVLLEISAIIQPTWVISILDLETKTYHSSISPKIKKMLNFISSPLSFCLLEEDRAAQIFAIFKLFRFSIFSYSLSYSTTIVLMTIRMT